MPSQIIDDPELRALVVPALRADVMMMETYRYQPEPPFAFGITAFAGNRDTVVKRPFMDEWRHQTTGAFRCEVLDSDHFFTQSARPRLLEAIAAGWKRLQDERLLASAVPGTCQ
jgi:medium-chain acyl-[acyl-carrier-protein] hydrolase